MRTLLGLPLLLALASGCSDDGDAEPDSAPHEDPVDADADGYRDATDCDDEDASAHPGASEACDGVDNDCDGNIDEDSARDATTWYLDADGDGYGDADADTVASCSQPDGYVASSGDCDDGDAGASPALPEACADDVDNDCDGSVDEEAADGDAWTWYLDADGDGYGDAAAPLSGCSAGQNYVTDATDCADDDSTVNPGADERCDGVDDDCDGSIDDDAVDQSAWHADADGDGYGDALDATQACEAPTGTVEDATDCDDGDGAIHPAALEVCDEVDNDCDSEIDEGLTLQAWTDGDGDGYGDPDTLETVCALPSGTVENDEDCDDGDAAINPAAGEVCDGTDNDCDGLTDGSDASDATAWYADDDDDGYGDPDDSELACATDSPAGFVQDDSDCDDGDPYIRPDAREYCDDIDNDCDGETDESTAIDAHTWYLDGDGDGYGDAKSSSRACYSAPDGYVSSFRDCDDDDESIHPDATEACDSVDNDCDGTVDDGVKTTYYLDDDDDGYGDPSASAESCSVPTGYVENGEDCDDDDALTWPGADERCDGVMNDCDGDGVPGDETDDDEDGYVECDTWEGAADLLTDDCDDDDETVHPGAATAEPSLCAMDSDGDGYGDSSVSGGLDAGTDCDDSDDGVYPGVAVNDGDLCTSDVDGDGYGDSTVSGALEAGTDCDDGDDSVYPGVAVEEPSLCTRDGDGDGYGDINAEATLDQGTDCDDESSTIHPEAATEEPSLCTRDRDGDGWGDQDVDDGVDEGSDCDDKDDDISPDAIELCDYIDNDCDGDEDESSARDATTYYADADDDGYGDKTSTTTQCFSAPDGYVSTKTDCDDDDSTVYPGATESCNYVDDDCDNATDEGTKTTYYADSDADGYGDPDNTTSDCAIPSGYTDDDTDCDDGNDDSYPGALELCDGDDNDCDDDEDEGIVGHYSSCSASSCEEIYDDPDGANDGDGYYYVDWDGAAKAVYCLMDHDEGGGWTRITYQDFGSDSSYSCMSDGEWYGTTAYSSYGIASVCYCNKSVSTDGVASRTFDVGDISYSEVLGYVEGYQFGSPDGFDGGDDTLGTPYTDGLSITLKNPSTNADHIFTYAVGQYRTHSDDSSCPDSLAGTGGDEPPDWVTDYDCESGNAGSSWDDKIYADYTLFEDEYFYVELSKSTTTDISGDLMQDESNSNEHFLLTKIILYIR